MRSTSISLLPSDDGNVCRLQDSGGDELATVSNPFPRPEGLGPLGSYAVAIFVHQNWPEATFRILKEDNIEVGHLFPASALSSNESLLLEDKYAASAAHVTIQKICSGQLFNEVDFRLPALSEEVFVDSILPENSVVAVISDERRTKLARPCTDLHTFMNRRLPSFAKEGLYLHSRPARDSFGSLATSLPSPGKATLRLHDVSSSLPDSAVDYLLNVVFRTVPFQSRPEFRFFLSYQALEILIDEIRLMMAAELAQLAASLSPTKLWDEVDKFRDDLSASRRLERLFGSSHDTKLYEEVMGACNLLITSVSEESQSSCAKAVYRVRNLLFHRFSEAYKLPEQQLEDASDRLLDLLRHFSIQYKPLAAPETEAGKVAELHENP
jgi:hypothetical protein